MLYFSCGYALILNPKKGSDPNGVSLSGIGLSPLFICQLSLF